MLATFRPLAVPVLALSVSLFGCADAEDPAVPEPPAEEAAPVEEEEPDAAAVMRPLGETELSGIVTFSASEDGLIVTYAIGGLTPGEHGFHVHENGSCDPGDDGTPGGAAGGHFDPIGAVHAEPTAPERHVGDFGNILAGVDGRAAGTFLDPVATLDGTTSIVGKAVIIHADADDLSSQPSGAAGSRVGCGVVTAMGATMESNLPPGHPPIN